MDKRCFFRWQAFLLVAAVLGLACNLTGGAETPPVVEGPTVAVSTATADLPEVGETPVPEDTAPTAAATATLPDDSEATPTSESAAVEPGVTPEATLEPVVAPPGTIAPGQQTSGSLESGVVQFYSFQGIRFEPTMVFVEGEDGLDIAVEAFPGAVAPGTELSQLTPVAQADFSPVGRPEVMVITPDEDGEYTVAVRGTGGTAGNFTLYMYNGTTPAANTRLAVNESLATGQTNNYKALSNGGRPVIVYADQTGQSDLVLRILDDDEALAAEANFGGPNSAETAFVLPLETTAYTIQVSTVNGETAVYNLVIVTLN